MVLSVPIVFAKMSFISTTSNSYPRSPMSFRTSRKDIFSLYSGDMVSVSDVSRVIQVSYLAFISPKISETIEETETDEYVFAE